MRKTLLLIALITTWSVLLKVPVWAQHEATEDLRAAPPSSVETAPAESSGLPRAQQKPPFTASAVSPEQTLVSTGGIVGITVKNTQGENLGEIQELMIDRQSGRIVYALVTCSGVFGLHQKTLAIPWETLKVGINQTDVVVELPNDQFSSPTQVTLSHR